MAASSSDTRGGGGGGGASASNNRRTVVFHGGGGGGGGGVPRQGSPNTSGASTGHPSRHQASARSDNKLGSRDNLRTQERYVHDNKSGLGLASAHASDAVSNGGGADNRGKKGGLKIQVSRDSNTRSVERVPKNGNNSAANGEHAKAEGHWQYQGPEGNVHGPFAATALLKWFEKGFFSGDLPVRCGTSASWKPLSSCLVKLRAEAGGKGEQLVRNAAMTTTGTANGSSGGERAQSARGARETQTQHAPRQQAKAPANANANPKTHGEPKQSAEPKQNGKAAPSEAPKPAAPAPASTPAPAPKPAAAPSPAPSPNASLHELHRRMMAGEVDLVAEPKKKGKKSGGGGGGGGQGAGKGGGGGGGGGRGDGGGKSNRGGGSARAGRGGAAAGGGGRSDNGRGGSSGNFEHDVAKEVFKGCLKWRYVDLEGNTQGPFGHDQIMQWHAQGYLHDRGLLMCGSSRTAMGLLKAGEPGTSEGVPDRSSFVSLRRLLIRGCELLGKKVPPAWMQEEEEAAKAAAAAKAGASESSGPPEKEEPVESPKKEEPVEPPKSEAAAAPSEA